jgi:hypothetical protein
MGNDSPGSSGRRGPFRLKFGSPVVPHPNLARSPAAPPASQSSAVANPIVVDPKHLSDLGQARRPGRAAVAFALAAAGIARGFLAQTTSRSSGQLCMLSKHAEILSKQAEILPKQMEKARKTVD